MHVALHTVLRCLEQRRREFLRHDNRIFNYCAHDGVVEGEIKTVGEEHILIISSDKGVGKGCLASHETHRHTPVGIEGIELGEGGIDNIGLCIVEGKTVGKGVAYQGVPDCQ